MKHDFRGFTLVEFLVVLAISALLIVVVVPGFYGMMQNNRIVTVTNKLAATFHYARSESIRRGAQVIVCASANQQLSSCSNDANDWVNGWIVFIDADTDTAINSNNDILRVHEDLPDNIGVAADDSQVIYTSSGFLNGATFTITIRAANCYGNNARQLTISPTGRLAVARIPC